MLSRKGKKVMVALGAVLLIVAVVAIFTGRGGNAIGNARADKSGGRKGRHTNTSVTKGDGGRVRFH